MSFMDVAQAYARRQSMIDPVLGPASLSKLPANVRMSMFVDPSRVPVVHHQQQQHLHIAVPVTVDYTSEHIMTYSEPPSHPTTPGVDEDAHLSNLLQDPFKTNNNSESSLNLYAEGSDSEEKGKGNVDDGDNSSQPPPEPPKDTHLDPTPPQLIPRQRTMAPPTLVTYRHTIHTPWSAPLTPASPLEEESISYQPPSRPTSPPTISERLSRKNSAILLGAKSNRKSMGGIPSNDDLAGGRNFSWCLQRATVVVPEGTAPVRLWKEDAPRVDTLLTSTPLTSVTLPVSGKLELEEESVRDGAAVFEGRSVSRRPSRDGELLLKSGEVSLSSETLIESEGSSPTTSQSTQQTFARKWAGGQIAVDIVGGELDGYLSKPDNDVVVRLPNPRGCLLEDDDELKSSFLYEQEQHHNMVSVVSSNMSTMSQHEHAFYMQQQQQQQQQQEILEQYQPPKMVKRNKNAGGRSYMDDFDQQQPLTQQTHKYRHSAMGLGGLGGDARELGKKLTGKFRNSMFLPSTSSTSASAETAVTVNANATETKGAENSTRP